MTKTITSPADDLAGITVPALAGASARAADTRTTECQTETRQRLMIMIDDGEQWVYWSYASVGVSRLQLIGPQDLRGREVWDALETDPDVGQTIATAEWAGEEPSYARWLTNLQIEWIDSEAAQTALTAVTAMRELEGVLAPVALSLLQLQDALSNQLTETHWVVLTDGDVYHHAPTLIEALDVLDYLADTDDDPVDLIVTAYRERGFADPDEDVRIMHSDAYIPN